MAAKVRRLMKEQDLLSAEAMLEDDDEELPQEEDVAMAEAAVEKEVEEEEEDDDDDADEDVHDFQQFEDGAGSESSDEDLEPTL